MNQNSMQYLNFRPIIWVTILAITAGFFFWFFSTYKHETPSYAEYNVLYPKYNQLKRKIDNVILNGTSYIAARKKLELIKFPPETLYFKMEHGDKSPDVLINNNYSFRSSYTNNGYGHGSLTKEEEIIKTVNISSTTTRDDISYSVFFSIPSVKLKENNNE